MFEFSFIKVFTAKAEGPFATFAAVVLGLAAISCVAIVSIQVASSENWKAFYYLLTVLVRLS